MKTLLQNLANDMMVFMRFGRRKVQHSDQIIADNMALIKQIRMHRINFYKHYKRSMMH